MSQFQFASPHFIHGIWLVLLLGGVFVWLDARGAGALARLMTPLMQARLVVRPSRALRVARIALLTISGLLMVAALMRPQWGITTVKSTRAGAEIMICLDVSRSMLAQDVVPNRLDRAKAEIRELLTMLDGDQVGLIAFAGRATVLSPLTPDFNFINVALNDATPSAVGRGGTRLEEPIRKAVEGFANVGQMARSILLITDGEDHDSFPREAAEAAAKRGIRILAIGFGDEAGSDIIVTDPTTGARSMVKDGDGRPVKTRLDGDLLRELATITSGAYIPAGTGLLDLESIFERHIAPLTRRNLESRERIIRRDIYQWPIALALAMMLIALTLNRRRAASNVIAAAGIALALTLSSVSEPSLAQAAQSSSIAPQASPPTPLRPVPAGEARAEPALPDNARSAYNDGVTSLATGNVERAGKVLEHARDIAGADAEVRFAATFNRGWVAVRQADDTLEEKPEEALAFLHEAARWFGDAVRLRPDELEPRQNLELVLRRALQLADQLADQKPSEIEGRLDALIAIQRGFIGTVANAVDAHDPKNAHADKRIRSLYRELALQAITILSDAGAASDDASRAADALTDEAVEDAEKALRKAGLEGVVAHLHKARERLSQGRARLRRAQGEGAFRRAAHALDSMQRARDQLRSPVERLDALIAALGELIQVTRLAQTEKRPSWASDGYLTNSNSSAKERADEVSKQFGSVTKTSPDAEQPEDEKTKQLRKNLLRAAPLVRQATEHLVQAEAALSRQALSVAHKHQSESFKELLKAREGFLDLRRLIEVVHRTETQVTNAVDGKVDEAELLHRAPAITALHANNIERMIRVGELISEEMTRQPEKDEEQANADGRAKHMEQGYSLWVKAQESMHAASTALGSLTQNRPQAKEHADAAMEGIETLQRHFFSLIEHLRETAEHQQRINDQTVELEGLVGTFDAAATRARTGPIGFTQTNNATRSEGIAQALNKQAEAQAKAPPSQPQPSAGGSISTAGSTTGSASAVSTPDQLKHAAALVTEGHSLMRESVALIETEPSPDLEGTRPKQDEALAKLLEAIAVLQPPEQNQNDQQQEQQSQQESQDEQEPQPGQQDNSSINQLLQGVRDRDAERRAYRAGQQSGREPVAKDW